MATQTAKGSGVTVNDGGTVLNGGTLGSDSPITNNLTILNTIVPQQANAPILAVSPTSSSNLGTMKANSSRNFAQMETNEYIGKIISTKIGGIASTVAANTGSDYGSRVPIHVWRGYESKGALSISDSTGVYSYAGGSTVQASGIDGTLGVTADVAGNPTDAVPGRLVIMVNGVNPTPSSYKPRTGN